MKTKSKQEWQLVQKIKLNPIQDRGEPKSSPLPVFSHVTSTNVGISLQNFPRLLVLLCKMSSLYLVPVLNYSTWTKITPQKMRFFWLNLYKIEVAITSFIDRNARVTKLWIWFDLNHVIKICWWSHRQELWRRNLFKTPLF